MKKKYTFLILLSIFILIAPGTIKAGDEAQKKLIAELYKTKAETPCPQDFMKYWNEQKAALKKVKMNVVSKPVPAKGRWKDKVKIFDVKIDCLGDVPVTGYLVMPINADKNHRYPVKVTLHGFTAAPRGAHIYDRETASTNIIHFDVNPHGNKNGQPVEYYKDIKNTFPKGARHFREYVVKNWNNVDKNYFKGMFIRVVRALEYVKTLEAWDKKNLIVWGSSMGGAQALVGAALDNEVTMCFANVPALADHLAKTPGWPKIAQSRKFDPKLLKKTAPYLDMVNFALYIKAKTFIGVGLKDTVCAPATIFAVYNNIKGIKKIDIAPEGVHGWNNFKKTAPPVLRQWLVK